MVCAPELLENYYRSTNALIVVDPALKANGV